MKTYDPKLIQVIVGGRALSGFADGTFVEVARANDAWSLQMGTDGEGTRSKSNDKSGTITITLMQSASDNAYLSNLALLDELENAGIVPVMIKDAGGSSLHAAEQAYVKKTPDSEYSREAGPRVWVIETDNLQNFIGGN